MINILNAIDGKPSKALRYMVQGLRNQDARKDFEVDMRTFGSSKGNICHGCGATCAIQEIAQKDLTPDDLSRDDTYDLDARTDALGFDRDELAEFELAIEYARQGYLFRLFEFCGSGCKHTQAYDRRFSLQTHNWHEQLSLVEDLISELESDGL